MFTEDLDAFLSESDFAVGAMYNGATPVSVIFDREYVEALSGVAGSNPVALGKATDFADPVDKTLVIGGTTYTIINKRPVDDGAFVLLDLRT